MNEPRLQTTDERLCAALERDLAETDRVTKLTNQQLVEEILNKLPFTDLDILIEEACTRLDPEWPKRDLDKPLSPEDKARLDRLTAESMARIDAITESQNEINEHIANTTGIRP